LAELARADCLLALAGDQPKAYQDALLVLEGLIDLPQLPLDAQAEVGYKWGITLLKQERREEALKVFTQMLGRLLLSDSASESFMDRGRYWLSRTLLEMGKLLKAMGDLDAAQRIYQKLIAYNLPGRAYAQDLLSRLVPGDDASAASN
jgi:tetratricopeptide (TPR) repeat protein